MGWGAAVIRYMLVDEDGALHERQAADYRAALADCGPEGWDKQRLGPDTGMCAFLNDCGLLLPEKYRRCVVAACMMVVLGAPPAAYAGPVVFTGWNDRATVAGQLEICSLSDDAASLLRHLHADVRRVLDLDEGAPSLPWIARPDFAQRLREYAAWLPTAPFQGITVLSDEDAINALRGRR